MSSVRSKPIPVETNEGTKHLFYDLNAIEILEEKLGDISKIGDLKPTVKNVKLLLWAGMLHENENLTLQQAGRLFQLADIPKVYRQIMLALNEGFPEPDPNGLAPEG